MSELPPDVEQQFAAIERANTMSRKANQEVMDSHLAAGSVVVGQMGAMAAQGVLQGVTFQGAFDGATERADPRSA